MLPGLKDKKWVTNTQRIPQNRGPDEITTSRYVGGFHS